MYEELRRAIIIDNYNNPFNKESVNDPNFIHVHVKSPTCIDDLTMFIKIENDIVVDAYFDGEACAISTSATSIFLRKIIGLKLDEVLKIMDNYNKMIEEKEYDSSCLEELNVYSEIYKQANRKRCALLPVLTMEKVIDEYEKEKV